MKNKKLIEILSKMDSNAEVKLHFSDGDSVLFVLASKQREGVIWLETQNDCDIGDEIASRFEYAFKEQVDELEFYADLVDTGITIKMVENVMGSDVAEHMQAFCVEHGLIV